MKQNGNHSEQRGLSILGRPTVWKRSMALLMLLVMLAAGTAYTDAKAESKSLWDRIKEGEGVFSTTLIYSGVISPTGTVRKGSSVEISGKLQLASVTGNHGNIYSLHFEIYPVNSYSATIDKKYDTSGKEINIADYSGAVVKEIANLPTGDYKYELTVEYEGKYGTGWDTVASTKFSISNDGQSYKKPTISISGTSSTSATTAGTGFGITGTVKTDCGTLTSVVVAIDGTTVRSYTPNSTSFNLGSKIGTLPETKQLDGGKHNYSVTVTAENGYQRVVDTVICQSFTVNGSLPKNQPKVTISSVSAPSSLKVGSNYGLRGVITAENCTLVAVYGRVKNSSGKVVLSGDYSINATTHDIRYSINNDLTFGKLSVGSYTYEVTVAYVTPQGERESKVLVQQSFNVYSGATEKPVTPKPQETGKKTGTWGSWSDWSTAKVTETSTRQVQTEVRTTTKTTYTYKHWHYTHKKNGAQNSYAEYKGSEYVSGSGKWEYYTTSTPLKQTDTKDGHKRYKVNGVSWYYETKNETVESVTYYRYRDLK